MPIEVERLVATLEAKMDSYHKQLEKASRATDRQFIQIEKRGKTLEVQLSRIGKRAGLGFTKALSAALGAGLTLRGAQSLIDASTRIENALKVAGLEGEALAAVYDRLFDSAQKNAAPLEALITLYGRAALVQKELGVSTEELLGFTDNVALALRVSGQSAAEASGALLQLSQALGSGVVRAEEFNSIMEGAQPIAQAAAAGLEEAGGSVAKLRQLVTDGKVSSEAFFRAFEAGSDTLRTKVSGAETTVSQSLVRLQNVLIDVAGRFDEMTGVSAGAANVIERFADVLDHLGMAMDSVTDSSFTQFISGLEESLTWLDEMERTLGFVESRLAAIQAYAKVFGMVVSGQIGAGGGAPGKPTDVGTITTPAEHPTMGGVPVPIPGTKPDIPTARVSLADYPVTGTSSGSSKNAYEREVQAIKDRTAAIAAEAVALVNLNPLVEDYGRAAAAARAEQDLLTAAQRAGVQVTPELEAQIRALADAYGVTEAEANKAAEAQDQVRRSAEELRDVGRDALSGVISDLRNGKSAADIMSNALDKLIDRLQEMALDNLFNGNGNGKGGGLFGALAGLLNFGGGGGGGGGFNPTPGLGLFAKGGVTDRPAIFGEGPMREAAVPLPDGRRIPVDLRGATVPNPPAVAGAPQGGGALEIRLGPGLEAQWLDKANAGAVQIVRASQPATIEAGASKAMSKLARGEADEVMTARFGVRRAKTGVGG